MKPLLHLNSRCFPVSVFTNIRSRWVIPSCFTFVSIFLPHQISFSVILRISTCSFKAVFVYVSGWVYVVCMFVPSECMSPWRPEECDRAPEARVPGSCELTITTGPLEKKVHSLNSWTLSLAQQLFLIVYFVNVFWLRGQ